MEQKIIPKIVPAEICDCKMLTEIAFKSKKHWNYPEEYYKIWEDELTITEGYILKNIVFKAGVNLNTIGFYSIVHNEEGFYSGNVFVQAGYWLEHIFIHPDYLRKGIGTILLKHAISYCIEKDIHKLLVFSDPNAKGFYEKNGAVFLCNSNSSIPNRNVPVFTFYTKKIPGENSGDII